MMQLLLFNSKAYKQTFCLLKRIQNNFFMKEHLRERKKSELPVVGGKENFALKLFPLQSSRDHLERRINTYGSFTHSEVKNILEEFIEFKKLRYLICVGLQLQYIYNAIQLTMEEQYSSFGQKCKIQILMEILLQGKFYRKLPKQNHHTFVGNSKSTATNINCIIAAILQYASGKLNVCQIQHILKVFEYEEKLSETYPFGIVIDSQRIMKILKKLQRSIKPMEFKQWIEDFKKVPNTDRLQNYHFLYLITLTQSKIDQNAYVFMNSSKNKELKANNQIGELQNEEKGLSARKKHPNSNQNQKYRIKSLSYQQDKKDIPSVIAFTEIKNQIFATNKSIQVKKKSLSLVNRMKDSYAPNCAKNFTEQNQAKDQILCCSRFTIDLKSASSRVRNIISSSEGKQNDRLDMLMPVVQVKGNKSRVVPFKNKKLLLNEEERKISNEFSNVYKYQENKIQKVFTDVSNRNLI